MFRDDSVISLPAPRASAPTGTGVSVAAQTVPVVDPELLRRAEAKRKYVAIYVVWVLGEPGFMLGKTRSPRDIPTQAERFNRRPIDFALLWCPSEEVADTLIARIKAEFKPFFAHGSWYDKIPALEAIRKVEHEAVVARVRLMNTAERDARLIDAVTYAMDEQKRLETAQDPRASRKGGGNTVVQFPKGAPR